MPGSGSAPLDNSLDNTRKASALRWLTTGMAAYVGWLAANLLLAVLFPVLALVRTMGGATGAAWVRRLCVWFLRTFFLGYFRWIGMYRVGEIPGAEELERLGPCVFVANHRSWLDGLLLLALFPNVRIPVNVGYTKVPLVGRIMKWLGSVPLDRRSRESVVKGVAELGQLLRDGYPVAVFPEGTRSPFGKLRLFTDFFFRVAIEAGVPVIPVLIHLDTPFLGPEENYLTRRRGVLTIRLLERVEPERGERGVDLSRRVRKKMAMELDKLDGKTGD